MLASSAGPVVWSLAPFNLVLLPVLDLKVDELDGDENHADDGRDQGSPMTQLIRSLAINLTGDNTGNVSDRLGNAQEGCSSVVRSRVVDDPSLVQARATVQGDGDKVASEVLDGRAFDGEKNRVSNDGKDVEHKQDTTTQAPSVTSHRSTEERDTTQQVDRDAQILGLEAGVSKTIPKDGGQKAAEAVEDNVLEELSSLCSLAVVRI